MDLSKNSDMMKTIVETFVIEETAELIYDNDKLQEWNDYIDKLGLKGQTTLVKPEKSPIPFMFMKESMVRMFRTLCPRTTDIEDYDVTPIPVEILELCMLSKKEKYFSKIQIWYDDSDPDPVCVGMTCQFYGYPPNGGSRTAYMNTRKEVLDIIGEGNTVYTANEKHYLIGKWADVKRGFKELKEMAIARRIEEQSIDFQTHIERYQRDLEKVEIDTKKYFA